VLATATVANIENCFIKSNVDFAAASGWLQPLVGPLCACSIRPVSSLPLSKTIGFADCADRHHSQACESAFYSTPSTLFETRAVRSYQAGHSGVRVAKGVYIGGTSGRSISTQQWAALDTGRLIITNQRLVFVGGKKDRTIALKKIVSVKTSLTEILLSVEGRRKTMALTVPNPLIAKIIIGLCSQVADPSNLSGDNLTVSSKDDLDAHHDHHLFKITGLLVKYWEIIADRLSKAGWSLGCV
jgi:hypothetical protein